MKNMEKITEQKLRHEPNELGFIDKKVTTWYIRRRLIERFREKRSTHGICRSRKSLSHDKR